MSKAKIERPPFVHNWVRYNFPDLMKTTKELVAFTRSMPQITYAAGGPIIRDRIALKLDRETAMKAAFNKGHEKSRPYVADYVSAFFDYDEIRKYAGLPSYDQYVAPYRISREIQIPVKPLIVISEGGTLKPIFVVGWATMPLTEFQRRLLMTVLEDAVFSLTDFQKSPGEFLSFPRPSNTNSGARAPEVWQRGDYKLLKDSEMKEQIGVYLEALSLAKKILAEEPAQQKDEKGKDAVIGIDPRQGEFDV